MISRLKAMLVDILLPNRCGSCARVISWDKTVCDKCEKQLEKEFISVCKICGKKPCKNHDLQVFDGITVLFDYSGQARKAVRMLKYHRGLNFAPYCAKHLAQRLRDDKLDVQTDLVTCVPMSRKKRRIKGYDHAELIARELAKELGKPLDCKLLVHAQTGTEQHSMNAKNRRAHANACFSCAEKHSDISGKTVLICDDIYTTGSTLNACALLLKGMGAKKVIAAAAATTHFKLSKKRVDVKARKQS